MEMGWFTLLRTWLVTLYPQGHLKLSDKVQKCKYVVNLTKTLPHVHTQVLSARSYNSLFKTFIFPFFFINAIEMAIFNEFREAPNTVKI